MIKGGGDGDGDGEMGVKRLGIPINQNDKGVGREGRGGGYHLLVIQHDAVLTFEHQSSRSTSKKQTINTWHHIATQQMTSY